jgi:thiosulfate reductase cytochrome b subunit
MRSTSPILVALLLAAWCLAACSVSAQASPSTQTCIKCHVKPAEAVTDWRIFHQDRWERSVHATLDCTTCHEGADAKAFDQLPHRLGNSPPPCMDCHDPALRVGRKLLFDVEAYQEALALRDDDFLAITEEVQRSVHAARLEDFSCVQCHNPHFVRSGLAALPREERVREANQACIKCHREAALEAAIPAPGKKEANWFQEKHSWDPAMEAHTKLRCVVCHTPIDSSNSHEVLPSDQSIRSCDACHDVNAPLIAEYIDKADPSFWITNPVLFKDAYVPGATRNRVVDGLLSGLFWLTVCGALAHALLRVLTRRNRPRMSTEAEKVKMYPVWLRVWHWSNAILFIVLAYTGVRMHFGQRRGPIMSFETAFDVHNLAGSLLVAIGVLFFVGNVLGRNQRQYLSLPRDGIRGILRQARWYLIGIFKGEPHPYHIGPEHKFNPLQHLTYVGVMYMMYPLLLLSGVALLFPGFLPRDVLGHSGVWWMAATHWIVAAAGIMFLAGHFYLGSMGDKVRDLYAAMLDGYHRHRTPKN